MKYWCMNCGEITGWQTEFFHSLGRMCKLCRSGKVTPIVEKKE